MPGPTGVQIGHGDRRLEPHRHGRSVDAERHDPREKEDVEIRPFEADFGNGQDRRDGPELRGVAELLERRSSIQSSPAGRPDSNR